MHNENKVPLIRLAKRDMMEPWKVWCIRLASIVLALLLGGLVMMIALPDGATPIDGYATIITGALGKKTAIRQTVKLAVPLLGCALAIAPCFKMRFWNIGAEGQITAGAIAASYFALYWVGKVPSAVLLLIMGLAGAVAGGIWALIPAFFKAKWNTNETLFTLMMNYIIIGVVRWLQGGPWEGRPGSQIIPQFDRAATLPKVLGVHCGWIIVLILVVFMHVYMNHTKHGYEIAVIGDSINTARYAGMNVGHVMMRTMFLSGAISGLVGFIVASGANTTLYDGVAAGVGFTSITVAWLSQLNAFAMIAISMMLAVISKGAETLQTRLAVPPRSPTSSRVSCSSVCSAASSSSTIDSSSARRRPKRRRLRNDFAYHPHHRRHHLRHPAAVRYARRDPDGKVRQPQPRRGGHHVHGRRARPRRCVLL